jgi:hypothetical protein
MTLVEAIPLARAKFNSATCFLREMREVERFSHHNLAEAQERFDNYLSAFLAEARSVQQILQKAVGWDAIKAVRTAWESDEQSVERTLSEMRNSTVHDGQGAADSTIQYVPRSELPRLPPRPFDPPRSGRRRLPGIPEPRTGVRRFTIRIGDREESAIESCNLYLELSGRIIDHFAGLSTPDEGALLNLVSCEEIEKATGDLHRLTGQGQNQKVQNGSW